MRYTAVSDVESRFNKLVQIIGNGDVKELTA